MATQRSDSIRMVTWLAPGLPLALFERVRETVQQALETSVGALKAAIRKYVRAHNRQYCKPFKWTKSARTILAAVERARKQTHR